MGMLQRHWKIITEEEEEEGVTPNLTFQYIENVSSPKQALLMASNPISDIFRHPFRLRDFKF